MSHSAYAELATFLQERVDCYWNEWAENDWEYVSDRFGATYDFDDSKEGAFFIWRREGFDPTLLLPRPRILDPNARDTSWRSCVAFDEHTTEYWFSDSTALFFAYAKWGSLPELGCQLFPSLGESEQSASGLMGAARLVLESPRKALKKRFDGSDLETTRWEVVSVGRGLPIWDRMSHRMGTWPAPPEEVPLTYVDDFSVQQTEWASRRECLGALLPDDLRSPFALDLISQISYALGWFALVNGLRAFVDHWQEINEVLATTPLQGFQPPS